MLESVCQLCDIAPERHQSNVIDYGNGGAAGAPSVLSQNWDSWTDKDDVAVIGVGSGLTWASYVLRFGDQP
jgi:3-oxoacyl-[acyl-carrier-protein] synthase-3